jgi:hypothetical protein
VVGECLGSGRGVLREWLEVQFTKRGGVGKSGKECLEHGGEWPSARSHVFSRPMSVYQRN